MRQPDELMQRNDHELGFATARQRWMSALLSLLVAFSVILHLGQATPAPAAMEPIVIVASSGHNSSPCEPGHSNAAHCSMTTACSLYASLEAAPVLFTAKKPQALPTNVTFQVSWSARPQLQPPQLSRQF